MNIFSSIVLLCAEAGHRVVTIGFEWLIQSTIVLGIGLAISVLAYRRGPAYRSAVHRASIAACIGVMLVSLLIHGRHTALITVTPAPAPTAAGHPVTEQLLRNVQQNVSSVQNALSDVPDVLPKLPEAGLDRQSVAYAVIGALWLLGVMAAFIRLAIGLRTIRQTALSGRQPQLEAAAALCEASKTMGLCAPPMVMSDQAHAPYIAGLNRPVIVIPTSLSENVHPSALRAILGHELIHFQRRDCWWYLTNRVLSGILWPQPLLWATMRCLEQANEEVCDEAAFRFGCSPADYARCLLQLADNCRDQSGAFAYAAGMAGFRSSLGRRVDHIMKGDSKMAGIGNKAKGVLSVGAALCALVGIVAFSVAAPKGPTGGANRGFVGAGDQSTPEATVRSFVDSINEKNLQRAAGLVQNGKTDPSLDSLAASLKKSKFKLTVKTVVAEVKDASAKVALELEMTEQDINIRKVNEFVSLTKVNELWLITPLTDIKDLTAGKEPNGFVGPLATMFANPELMKAARGSACLSNIKQICLGALMLCQDYNSVFKITATDFKKRIMPYIKNESVFHCTIGEGAGFAVNANIAGKKLVSIHAPAETVLFYEGKSGKFDFRHGGKACVGFVDGHAKMLTEAEAAKVLWKP